MQKILLADDDNKVLETIERHLKRMGYSDIDKVKSGKEAVKRLEKTDYDVIISDYHMDNGNGFSVLENNKNESPFILITGHLDKDLSKQFANNDAFRILEKPFELDDLESAVNAAMIKREKDKSTKKHMMIGLQAGHTIHDLNNQLQIMDMSSDIGVRSSSEEKQIANFQRIKKAVGIASGIVKNYKSVHQSELNYNQLNLSDFVKDLESDYKDILKKKFNIEFSVKVNDDNAFIAGDEIALSQVIGNLISNAKDAIENEDEKWIKVTLNKLVSGKVDIIVEDSGYMEDHKREVVFVEGFTTKGSLGTGKGLCYCKQIVELHMGDITVENAENTTFKVSLPLSH